ncbi:hypothetical protein PR048_018484 [Dryococelus australis]|uniref:DUF5641 domain-containing protein n=1 Tax=Dryococelus australis TaxID=614101 RepID=A0ABQ9HCH7_9NEOP|nr:hypothetical protein PR048_018484 [Dryococelus australis]
MDRAVPKAIKVGDVVPVSSDNLKRVNWPLALVLEVYPGTDGTTRVAMLKTHEVERIRPFQCLYPLEVHSLPEDWKITEGEVNDSPDMKSSQEVAKVSRAGRRINALICEFLISYYIV